MSEFYSIPFVCDRTALIAELSVDEGRRYKRYRCPAGHWTIGVGHNLESAAPLSSAVWAMIKRECPHVENALLDDQCALSGATIDQILDEDLQVCIQSLDALWIGWRALSEQRKRALINLVFQMGYSRFAGFVRFWRAMKQHNFENAADELVNSLWYRQTQPSRSLRVIAQIRDRVSAA
jgi:lysozyme